MHDAQGWIKLDSEGLRNRRLMHTFFQFVYFLDIFYLSFIFLDHVKPSSCVFRILQWVGGLGVLIQFYSSGIPAHSHPSVHPSTSHSDVFLAISTSIASMPFPFIPNVFYAFKYFIHIVSLTIPFSFRIYRWIKYEEEVEESADRWSKPHVAIQPLMSVFEVRSCLAKAVMLLDLDVMSLELVAGELLLLFFVSPWGLMMFPLTFPGCKW